ncbi:MAG: PrsW family glutamic-type intramembrane protease [Candidatus Heimdallarchaeaceae archaeon]
MTLNNRFKQKKDRNYSDNIFSYSSMLFSSLFNSNTLVKFFIVIALGGALFTVLSFLERFQNSSYLPILVILILTLFFVFWIYLLFFSFSITATKIEKNTIRKIFPLLLVMSILSTYFAVVIENKMLNLVGTISSLFEQFNIVSVNVASIQLFFYVFVIPVIEEIGKIFPILILMGNYVKLKFKEKTVLAHLTPSHRVIVILGGFFGCWFDLFEQYLSYSANSTSIDTLIFGRAIFPLHSVASMITAFGLAWVFVSKNRWRKVKQYLVFVIFLSISVLFHGLWNFYSIVDINLETRTSYLAMLGYVSYAFFVFFVFWILLRIPKLCPLCNTEHKGACFIEAEDETKEIMQKINKARYIKPLYESNSSDSMVCSECQKPMYNGSFCLNCWSFPKLQCQNCNQVVPAFSRVCWSCGSEIPTLYDKMTSSSPPFYVSFSVGFTQILGAGMLVSFIFALISLPSTFSYLGHTVFLLSIIVTVFISISWYYLGKNKVKSMLSSINVLSILALSVIIMSLYLMVFAILMIVSIVQIITGLVAFSCLIILSVVSIVYLKKVVKGARLIII